MKLLDRIRLSRLVVPKSAWLDGLTLLGVLVLVNSLAARTDFGWLTIHPSPYFLLPILLGCRYGFAAGSLAGLVAATIIIGGRAALLGAPVAALVADQGYLVGALIVLGGLCGEIQNALRRKELQLTALYEHAQARLRRLDDDLKLLRESKAELERVLASQDAEVANLDSEMRRLGESETEELYPNLLLLLSRQARLTDAAVYTHESADAWQRRALIGEPQFLPPQLRAEDVELMRLAIAHKTVASIPEFWRQVEGAQRQYLLALPILDAQDQILALLVVTGMPFVALNRRTIQLTVLICRWAGRVLDIRRQSGVSYRLVGGLENQRILFPQVFRKTLELAHSACRLHNLPSFVLLFALPKAPQSLQDRLERAVMSNVRGGDYPGALELAVPNLAVLLPLTGERGATIFRERVLAHCRKDPELAPLIQDRLVEVLPTRSFEELWQDLMELAKLELGSARRRPKPLRV